MSLFGSMMGDFDDDPFFGAHMRSMRQMNNMMNSLFSDPFGMMGGMPSLTNGPSARTADDSLMPFGFPGMNFNINRLLGGSLDSLATDATNGNCHSYTSSSVVRMTSGPDGKPQVYRASASTRTGPGGVRETQRSVQDSRTGTKKLAIGHHIGERAHLVEREENFQTGDKEERQEFINLDEEEADDFNKEFETKTRPLRAGHASGVHSLTGGQGRNRQLALPPATGSTGVPHSTSAIAARTPYSPAGQSQPNRRHQRNIKTVSGPPDL